MFCSSAYFVALDICEAEFLSDELRHCALPTSCRTVDDEHMLRARRYAGSLG